MARPNLTALTLSAAIVAGAALLALRSQAILPAIGLGKDDGSTLGAERTAPAAALAVCQAQGRVPFEGYQFDPICAGQAPSFDRRLFVGRNAGTHAGIAVRRTAGGASLGDLGTLDGTPFTLFWSPRAYRFFANQHGEDGIDRLRLFELQGEALSEQPALAEAAANILRRRYPCIAAIGVSGIRWAADGRRIVLLVYMRDIACGGAWRPMWMIGDAGTGQIDPASIRERFGRAPLPADGPYANL